jgi:SulP family sulfate permease
MALLQQKKAIIGDVFGGVSAAIISFPTSLALGIASGLGGLAGIYGAILGGGVASLFGSSVLQISGPTGPISVILASLYAKGETPTTLLLVVILAGVLQLVFALFRLGKLIEYLPYPVISGFMTGVALLLFRTTWVAIEPSFYEYGLAILVAVSCLVSSKYSKQLPPVLLPLILGVAIRLLLPVSFATIPSLSFFIPTVTTPSLTYFFSDGLRLIPYAFSLALLCSIDTLLTARILDTRSQEGGNLQPNRELIGQGMGNIIAGLFGGVAVAGATMRSFANQEAGAKTRFSGIVHSVVLLLILVNISTVQYFLPMALLHGIILFLGVKLIDWRNVRAIPYTPIADTIVMGITIVLTVTAGLLESVGIALFFSSLLFIRQMSNLLVSNVPLDTHLPPDQKEIGKKYDDQIHVFEIRGPLFFASTSVLSRELADFSNAHVLILKMYAVPTIDQTALKVLDLIIQEAKKHNITIMITGLHKNLKSILHKAGMVKAIGEDNFFHNPMEAVQTAIALVRQSNHI